MVKKVAIVQSNYIPWKGYFDLIRGVDEFILYDDAQFTVRDWRNRNLIKTNTGVQWLTIPVTVGGRRNTAIKDVKISEPSWGKRHWEILRHTYSKAPYFKTYRDVFEPLYLKNPTRFLSHINRAFIETINGVLGISTLVTFSMDYRIAWVKDRNQRLLNLCRHVGATEYLSGPTARSYFDVEFFKREGIRVRFADYAGYPSYHQLHPPLVHEVSILDLIFNTGKTAPKYLKDL